MWGHKRISSLVRAWPALLLVGLAAACNGETTDPDINEAFIGDWVATSFIIDGVEQITPGGQFNMSFGFYSDGSYQLIVSGDTSGLLCGGPASCNENGDFAHSGSVITIDPGTADALNLQYSVSGTMLSVSGTLDNTPFSATFERV